MHSIIILCFFAVVAHGVNLCYKLDQSVVHTTDGLGWLWTQLWLCPKQRTAALLSQTKTAAQKIKNSQSAFLAAPHSKESTHHQANISLAIFTPYIRARAKDSLLSCCFSHCTAFLVVRQRREKMSENILVLPMIWLMARPHYILTNFLMIFE